MKYNTGSLKNEYEFLSKKKWLTTRELAIYLGTSAQGVRSLIYRGLISPRKPFSSRGKSYFKREEVDSFIECSESGGSECQ